VTVVIPTLANDAAWRDCLRSLERQTFRDFEVTIVDNSGRRVVSLESSGCNARVLHSPSNTGFGAAINRAARESAAPFIAAFNDDAEAEPQWLEALHNAVTADPRLGMAASRVLLAESGLIDSAGMLLSADASTKQRGHRRPEEDFSRDEEALFPSGSAALYRRELFSECGGYDESFFLYCEDSDLGLRAHWAGYSCRYVAGARVSHRYSHSAGRASALKAYLVERNRLRLAVKNFPLSMLLRLPAATLARYWAHFRSIGSGSGAAAEFARHESPIRLVWFAIKAHLALLPALPALLRERRRILSTARMTATEFRALARRHAISPREVAAQ